jgi:hypothetical protein
MDELDMIGKVVSIKFASCTVVNTGDLLAGKSGATRHEVLDAMIAHWMSDPVHGKKAGYSKLAMKLAETVEADLVPKPHTKKTTTKRVASLEASSSSSGYSRNVRGRGGLDTGHVQPGITPESARGMAPQLHPRRQSRRRRAWRRRSQRRRPRKRPHLQQLLLEPVCSMSIPASCIVLSPFF